MPIFLLQPQCRFNDLELYTLKTRGRTQEIPEIQKIQGGHRLHDINLFHQQLQNDFHPTQSMENMVKIRRIIRDNRLLK